MSATQDTDVSKHEDRFRQLKSDLRRLERRDWWLWWCAVAVILLLTAGLVSFSVPALVQEFEWLQHVKLEAAMRGLVGVVLLFNVYTFYQHITISRFRRELLDQQLLVERFRQMAMFDPLTGLFNRRFGEDRLQAEITRSFRHGYPLTILLFDLDDFKQINDTYGHAVGDAALKNFADQLLRISRRSDLAVRLGGDEFLLVLPDCQAGDVQTILTRLRPLAVSVNGQHVPFVCSAGSADYRTGETLEQLLARADHELYAQKFSGVQASDPHPVRN